MRNTVKCFLGACLVIPVLMAGAPGVEDVRVRCRVMAPVPTAVDESVVLELDGDSKIIHSSDDWVFSVTYRSAVNRRRDSLTLLIFSKGRSVLRFSVTGAADDVVSLLARVPKGAADAGRGESLSFVCALVG